MNPNLLAALELPTFDAAKPEVETPSYGEIIGKNLANVLPKAASSLGSSLESILNLGITPEEKVDIPDVPLWTQEPQLTSQATGGQKLTNVLTGGVLPELAALFIPYVGATKIGKVAGLGRLGQTVLGNITQGAVGGIKYGPEQAVEGAALGGVLSGIGAVPGVMRRAALTAPIAGFEYGLHENEGRGQAATAAATTLLGGLLPSISREKNVGVATGEQFGPHIPVTDADLQLPEEWMRNHPNPEFQPRLYSPTAATPDARYWNMLEWPHGEAIKYSPSGDPIPMFGPEPIFTPEKRAAYMPPAIIGGERGPLANLVSALPQLRERAPAIISFLEAEMPGIALTHDLPISNVRSPEFSYQQQPQLALPEIPTSNSTLESIIPAKRPKNITFAHLKKKAESLGYTIEDDKDNATIHIYAPEGLGWEEGNLSTLSEGYGHHGSYLPKWRKEVIESVYDRLDEYPPEHLKSYVDEIQPTVDVNKIVNFQRNVWKKMETVEKATLDRGAVKRDSRGRLWQDQGGGDVRYLEAAPYRAEAEIPPPVQRTFVDENTMEAAKEAAHRGRLQSLPEYRRTEGGIIAPELLNTLGQSAVGGLAGYVLDQTNILPDVNFTALGAGLPLIPAIGRGLTNLLKSNEVGGIANPYPKGLPSSFSSSIHQIEDEAGDIIEARLHQNNKEGGKITATVEGNNLRVFSASLDDDLQNQKYGLHLYDKLIDEAKAKGLTLVSDDNVSDKAARVYEALARRGYQVTKNPNAEFIYAGGFLPDGARPGMWISHDQSPIFKVEGSPIIDTAERLNAKYDGFDPLTNQHQLTLQDNGTTIYVPKNATTDEVANLIAAKRAEFGGEQIDSPEKVDAFLASQNIPVNQSNNLQPLRNVEGGLIVPELASSLGGGVLGALTGYATSEGDPYAAGAGALLGAAGGAAIASAFKSPGIQATAQAIKQEVKGARLTKSLNSAFKDLTEGNTYGQGGPFSRLFDFADKQFGLTNTPQLRAAVTEARGKVAALAERSMAYLKPYLTGGSLSSQLIDKANKYLDGISSSVTDEINFLQANKGIDSIAYDALQPIDRKGYTTWRVSEDIVNPAGVGPHQAVKMHVPLADLDSLKKQWNQKLTQDFLSSVSVDELPAAEAIVKARGNFNEIQEIFSRALPAGPNQQLVTESIGRYVPRLFRAFTDKNFKVSDIDVASYINEFGLNKRTDFLTTSLKSGEAYDSQAFTQMYNNARQNQKTLTRLNQFVPHTVDGRKVFVLPHVREQLDALENDVHLENMVRAHLQESGVSEEMQRTGAASGGLDPTMFKAREDLTPAFRKLLGEYTDPVERMAMAFSRTFAPAQAASLMDVARNITLPSGLKSAYEPAEWSQMLTRATQAGDQQMIQELKQMKLIGKSAVFGEYAGNYVNRHLADYFEGGSQIWNQSIGRGIAEFNKLFKTGHVPLNPLSHIRQIVSIPAFLAIGKTAPQDVRQAWNALFAGAKEEGTVNALTRDELLSVGAWTSDLIKGELQGNIDTFLSGRYDSELMKKTKGVVNQVLEAYRKPDMLVRAATYLGAKRRALESGMNSDQAKQAALQWMDRYTMNYDNIAPAVRFLRNIPGVSPFISYQAEMARLVKNMIVDGVKGNPERLGTLAAITAIPLGAATVAEGMLSPEDKKEWTKTKALMPDYNKGRIIIPTGKNPNGSMKFWDISPDVAHSDLIKLVSNFATGNVGAAISQNPFIGTTSSPILQALAKVTTQRDPRTNQDLGSSGQAALSAISDILPPITPGLGYEWKRLANVEVENLYTGRKESWGDWATRLATGITGSSARLSTLQQTLKQEFSRTAANARAEYLRTARLTGENPGLSARKAAAYETYRQTMANALTSFYQKSGLEPLGSGKLAK